MGEGNNLIGVYSSVVASLCYCYFISSRIPRGRYRFISLLPIFYLFTILPLSLSFALTKGITTSFITWLANFKLLLYSFDQGPLSHYGHPPKEESLLLFITIAALPIKIKQNNHNPDPKSSSELTAEPKRKIPLNLAVEATLVAILATVLHGSRNGDYIELHPKVVLILYCCFLYLMVNVVVGSLSAILGAVFGLELEPPSDEPYLSTSLQDFWGKRWNLMVTNTLRHTVYIPVRSSTTGLLGKDKASLVAVFASFVVSAIMHEVILFHQTRARPTWEYGSFFLLHGICVVVELVMKRSALAERWSLPAYVSRLLTVGFVVVTGFWLFFPPMTDNGIDVKVINEVMFVVESMKQYCCPNMDQLYSYINNVISSLFLS